MKAPKMNTTTRELVPEGNHVARLYEIMYLGTQETPFFNEDGTKKEQYKVRLTFELPNEKRVFKEGDDEKPMVISKEVTFSLYKGTQIATLRTIVHALIGTQLKDEEAENFDLDEVLGKACMVEVSHEEYNENTYAKAVGFGSIPKGVDTPEAVNEARTLSVDDITQEQLDKLPEFISKKFTASKEYQERMRQSGTGTQEINSEDIPF